MPRSPSGLRCSTAATRTDPGSQTGATGGTIHSVNNKTTIYLPDDLRDSVKAEAKRRGCSEAQVIRDAISRAVTRPRPNPGILDDEAIADRVDELLAGFGDR